MATNQFWKPRGAPKAKTNSNIPTKIFAFLYLPPHNPKRISKKFPTSYPHPSTDPSQTSLVSPTRARARLSGRFCAPRAVVCVSSRVFYFTGLRVLEFGFLVSSLANRTTSHTTHRSVVSCEGTRAISFDCCWVLQRLRFESLGIERCARTYAYAAGILNEFPTLLRRFGLRGTNRTVTACLAQRST